MSMRYTVGDKVSITRTFSAEDVNSYAELTGDNNPIHMDEAYASTTIFGRRIVQGILAVSLFSRIFGTQYPGSGSIYMMQNCKFVKPVFVGEELRAEVELIELDEQRMIGLFNTSAYNKFHELVIVGQAKIKLPV